MRTTFGSFGSGEEDDEDEELVAVVDAEFFFLWSESELVGAAAGRARFRQNAEPTRRQRRVSETSGTEMTRARGRVSDAR